MKRESAKTFKDLIVNNIIGEIIIYAITFCILKRKMCERILKINFSFNTSKFLIPSNIIPI